MCVCALHLSTPPTLPVKCSVWATSGLTKTETSPRQSADNPQTKRECSFEPERTTIRDEPAGKSSVRHRVSIDSSYLSNPAGLSSSLCWAQTDLSVKFANLHSDQIVLPVQTLSPWLSYNTTTVLIPYLTQTWSLVRQQSSVCWCRLWVNTQDVMRAWWPATCLQAKLTKCGVCVIIQHSSHTLEEAANSLDCRSRGRASLKPWLSVCEHFKRIGAAWRRDIDYVNELERPLPPRLINHKLWHWCSSENWL